MANPTTIDAVLEEFAGTYGKWDKWTQAARGPWGKQLRDLPDEDLRAAAAAWMADAEHTGPPTPAQLLVGRSRRRGGAACALCADGLREMAVHRRFGSEIQVRVGVLRCDCDAGDGVDVGDKARTRPRIPTIEEQLAHLSRDPHVLRWFLDPLPHQRENLEAPAPRRSSTAIAHVRALMVRDPDPHAVERKQALDRDRMRDAAGDAEQEALPW